MLVAEDNAVNQQVALGQLKHLGYTGEAVSNGLAVLEALNHTHYDIILMDCQMPEMDGYEATRRIRERTDLLSQPYIIALTAHAMQGASEKCRAAGMDDYVSKPIVLETFAAALARGVPKGINEWPEEVMNIVELKNKRSVVVNGRMQRETETESAICKTTLQGLKELGAEMGPLFFPQLLETFEHDAIEHLVALRSAIASGETGRLRGEAHALKGASLTIGAKGMAKICQQLENLGTSQSIKGAEEELALLDGEFDRVKTQIVKESLIP